MALHPRTIDLSLDRLYRLLSALGDPHLHVPPVVHIAGTNGKGSTTAYMRSILEQAGRAVHVYTSPHLVHFNERIRLAHPDGGKLVSDDELIEAMLIAEAANEGHPITVFEITTAIAFQLFASRPADVLLLEVGLGGRLDATNVIDDPVVSVITPIGMDHEKFLGDTIEQIAGEKAGILKPNARAVSAAQVIEVRQTLVHEAARRGTEIAFADEDWSILEENGRLVYQDDQGLLDLPRPRLYGRHQIANAGLAVAALRVAGLCPDQTACEAGLKQTDWPARMQRLTGGPLVDQALPETEIWLDGGHNPSAGEAIAATLADLEDRVERPIFLICGMLNTKDPEGFLAPFHGLVRHAFMVPVEASDASRSPEELVKIAESVGLSAEVAQNVASALKTVGRNWQFERTPRVLICGSLYLAGSVLAENQSAPS